MFKDEFQPAKFILNQPLFHQGPQILCTALLLAAAGVTLKDADHKIATRVAKAFASSMSAPPDATATPTTTLPSLAQSDRPNPPSAIASGLRLLKCLCRLLSFQLCPSNSIKMRKLHLCNDLQTAWRTSVLTRTMHMLEPTCYAQQLH